MKKMFFLMLLQIFILTSFDTSGVFALAVSSGIQDGSITFHEFEGSKKKVHKKPAKISTPKEVKQTKNIRKAKNKVRKRFFIKRWYKAITKVIHYSYVISKDKAQKIIREKVLDKSIKLDNFVQKVSNLRKSSKKSSSKKSAKPSESAKERVFATKTPIKNFQKPNVSAKPIIDIDTSFLFQEKDQDEDEYVLDEEEEADSEQYIPIEEPDLRPIVAREVRSVVQVKPEKKQIVKEKKIKIKKVKKVKPKKIKISQKDKINKQIDELSALLALVDEKYKQRFELVVSVVKEMLEKDRSISKSLKGSLTPLLSNMLTFPNISRNMLILEEKLFSSSVKHIMLRQNIAKESYIKLAVLRFSDIKLSRRDLHSEQSVLDEFFGHSKTEYEQRLLKEFRKKEDTSTVFLDNLFKVHVLLKYRLCAENPLYVNYREFVYENFKEVFENFRDDDLLNIDFSMLSYEAFKTFFGVLAQIKEFYEQKNDAALLEDTQEEIMSAFDTYLDFLEDSMKKPKLFNIQQRVYYFMEILRELNCINLDSIQDLYQEYKDKCVSKEDGRKNWRGAYFSYTVENIKRIKLAVTNEEMRNKIDNVAKRLLMSTDLEDLIEQTISRIDNLSIIGDGKKIQMITALKLLSRKAMLEEVFYKEALSYRSELENYITEYEELDGNKKVANWEAVKRSIDGNVEMFLTFKKEDYVAELNEREEYEKILEETLLYLESNKVLPLDLVNEIKDVCFKRNKKFEELLPLSQKVYDHIFSCRQRLYKEEILYLYFLICLSISDFHYGDRVKEGNILLVDIFQQVCQAMLFFPDEKSVFPAWIGRLAVKNEEVDTGYKRALYDLKEKVLAFFDIDEKGNKIYKNILTMSDFKNHKPSAISNTIDYLENKDCNQDEKFVLGVLYLIEIKNMIEDRDSLPLVQDLHKKRNKFLLEVRDLATDENIKDALNKLFDFIVTRYDYTIKDISYQIFHISEITKLAWDLYSHFEEKLEVNQKDRFVFVKKDIEKWYKGVQTELETNKEVDIYKLMFYIVMSIRDIALNDFNKKELGELCEKIWKALILYHPRKNEIDEGRLGGDRNIFYYYKLKVYDYTLEVKGENSPEIILAYYFKIMHYLKSNQEDKFEKVKQLYKNLNESKNKISDFGTYKNYIEDLDEKVGYMSILAELKKIYLGNIKKEFISILAYEIEKDNKDRAVFISNIKNTLRPERDYKDIPSEEWLGLKQTFLICVKDALEKEHKKNAKQERLFYCLELWEQYCFDDSHVIDAIIDIPNIQKIEQVETVDLGKLMILENILCTKDIEKIRKNKLRHNFEEALFSCFKHILEKVSDDNAPDPKEYIDVLKELVPSSDYHPTETDPYYDEYLLSISQSSSEYSKLIEKARSSIFKPYSLKRLKNIIYILEEALDSKYDFLGEITFYDDEMHKIAAKIEFEYKKISVMDEENNLNELKNIEAINKFYGGETANTMDDLKMADFYKDVSESHGLKDVNGIESSKGLEMFISDYIYKNGMTEEVKKIPIFKFIDECNKLITSGSVKELCDAYDLFSRDIQYKDIRNSRIFQYLMYRLLKAAVSRSETYEASAVKKILKKRKWVADKEKQVEEKESKDLDKVEGQFKELLEEAKVLIKEDFKEENLNSLEKKIKKIDKKSARLHKSLTKLKKADTFSIDPLAKELDESLAAARYAKTNEYVRRQDSNYKPIKKQIDKLLSDAKKMSEKDLSEKDLEYLKSFETRIDAIISKIGPLKLQIDSLNLVSPKEALDELSKINDYLETARQRKYDQGKIIMKKMNQITPEMEEIFDLVGDFIFPEIKVENLSPVDNAVFTGLSKHIKAKQKKKEEATVLCTYVFLKEFDSKNKNLILAVAFLACAYNDEKLVKKLVVDLKGKEALIIANLRGNETFEKIKEKMFLILEQDKEILRIETKIKNVLDKNILRDLQEILIEIDNLKAMAYKLPKVDEIYILNKIEDLNEKLLPLKEKQKIKILGLIEEALDCFEIEEQNETFGQIKVYKDYKTRLKAFVKSEEKSKEKAEQIIRDIVGEHYSIRGDFNKTNFNFIVSLLAWAYDFREDAEQLLILRGEGDCSPIAINNNGFDEIVDIIWDSGRKKYERTDFEERKNILLTNYQDFNDFKVRYEADANDTFGVAIDRDRSENLKRIFDKVFLGEIILEQDFIKDLINIIRKSAVELYDTQQVKPRERRTSQKLTDSIVTIEKSFNNRDGYDKKQILDMENIISDFLNSDIAYKERRLILNKNRMEITAAFIKDKFKKEMENKFLYFDLLGAKITGSVSFHNSLAFTIEASSKEEYSKLLDALRNYKEYYKSENKKDSCLQKAKDILLEYSTKGKFAQIVNKESSEWYSELYLPELRLLQIMMKDMIKEIYKKDGFDQRLEDAEAAYGMTLFKPVNIVYAEKLLDIAIEKSEILIDLIEGKDVINDEHKEFIENIKQNLEIIESKEGKLDYYLDKSKEHLNKIKKLRGSKSKKLIGDQAESAVHDDVLGMNDWLFKNINFLWSLLYFAYEQQDAAIKVMERGHGDQAYIAQNEEFDEITGLLYHEMKEHKQSVVLNSTSVGRSKEFARRETCGSLKLFLDSSVVVLNAAHKKFFKTKSIVESKFFDKFFSNIQLNKVSDEDKSIFDKYILFISDSIKDAMLGQDVKPSRRRVVNRYLDNNLEDRIKNLCAKKKTINSDDIQELNAIQEILNDALFALYEHLDFDFNSFREQYLAAIKGSGVDVLKEEVIEKFIWGKDEDKKAIELFPLEVISSLKGFSDELSKQVLKTINDYENQELEETKKNLLGIYDLYLGSYLSDEKETNLLKLLYKFDFFEAYEFIADICLDILEDSVFGTRNDEKHKIYNVALPLYQYLKDEKYLPEIMDFKIRHLRQTYLFKAGYLYSQINAHFNENNNELRLEPLFTKFSSYKGSWDIDILEECHYLFKEGAIKSQIISAKNDWSGSGDSDLTTKWISIINTDERTVIRETIATICFYILKNYSSFKKGGISLEDFNLYKKIAFSLFEEFKNKKGYFSDVMTARLDELNKLEHKLIKSPNYVETKSPSFKKRNFSHRTSSESSIPGKSVLRKEQNGGSKNRIVTISDQGQPMFFSDDESEESGIGSPKQWSDTEGSDSSIMSPTSDKVEFTPSPLSRKKTRDMGTLKPKRGLVRTKARANISVKELEDQYISDDEGDSDEDFEQRSFISEDALEFAENKNVTPKMTRKSSDDKKDAPRTLFRDIGAMAMKEDVALKLEKELLDDKIDEEVTLDEEDTGSISYKKQKLLLVDFFNNSRRFTKSTEQQRQQFNEVLKNVYGFYDGLKEKIEPIYNNFKDKLFDDENARSEYLFKVWTQVVEEVKEDEDLEEKVALDFIDLYEKDITSWKDGGILQTHFSPVISQAEFCGTVSVSMLENLVVVVDNIYFEAQDELINNLKNKQKYEDLISKIETNSEDKGEIFMDIADFYDQIYQCLKNKRDEKIKQQQKGDDTKTEYAFSLSLDARVDDFKSSADDIRKKILLFYLNSIEEKGLNSSLDKFYIYEFLGLIFPDFLKMKEIKEDDLKDLCKEQSKEDFAHNYTKFLNRLIKEEVLKKFKKTIEELLNKNKKRLNSVQEIFGEKDSLVSKVKKLINLNDFKLKGVPPYENQYISFLEYINMFKSILEDSIDKSKRGSDESREDYLSQARMIDFKLRTIIYKVLKRYCRKDKLEYVYDKRDLGEVFGIKQMTESGYEETKKHIMGKIDAVLEIYKRKSVKLSRSTRKSGLEIQTGGLASLIGNVTKELGMKTSTINIEGKDILLDKTQESLTIQNSKDKPFNIIVNLAKVKSKMLQQAIDFGIIDEKFMHDIVFSFDTIEGNDYSYVKDFVAGALAWAMLKKSNNQIEVPKISGVPETYISIFKGKLGENSYLVDYIFMTEKNEKAKDLLEIIIDIKDRYDDKGMGEYFDSTIFFKEDKFNYDISDTIIQGLEQLEQAA